MYPVPLITLILCTSMLLLTRLGPFSPPILVNVIKWLCTNSREMNRHRIFVALIGVSCIVETAELPYREIRTYS